MQPPSSTCSIRSGRSSMPRWLSRSLTLSPQAAVACSSVCCTASSSRATSSCTRSSSVAHCWLLSRAGNSQSCSASTMCIRSARTRTMCSRWRRRVAIWGCCSGYSCEGVCIPDRSRSSQAPSVHDVPKCAPQKLLTVARQHKHVRMVRWLHETYFPGDTTRLGGVGDLAAGTGDLDAVRWLHELSAKDSFTYEAVDNAARAGHTEVVEFLLSKRSEGFSSNAVAGAMVGRHGAIAALLRPNGWELEDFSTHVMMEAARCGRLDLLQMDNPYGASFAFSTSQRFIMLGELPGNSHHMQRVMQLACEAAHLDIVKWLVEYREVTCDAHCIHRAVLKSERGLLEWIHENECGVWQAEHMDEAAGLGDLDMLRWFHRNRHEGCTTNAMDNAARGGDLHVLKWLKENCFRGCSSEAFLAAVSSGHLEMVQWLHANQLDIDVPDAIDYAADHGHLKIVQWLHANRPGLWTTSVMDGAAYNGHLDVVMWLHEHRKEGCTESAMNFAPLIVVR